MNHYPVEAILPAFSDILKNHNRCIVSAAPGAGKTTVLPLHLLDAPWRGDGKILILEPRRLAVFAAACRLAENLGEKPGERVGYRIRLENCISKQTKIELITEGILTRMLQDDPELTGISAVIFDEFHERTIHGDTALALALDTQNNLRPDLKIIVMSATLDIQRLKTMLDAPAVVSEGRSYPVEVYYQDSPSKLPLPEQLAGVIERALAAQPGSILAFLPGEAPIRRTAELLRGKLPGDTELFELYGRLPQEVQRRAIAPPEAGRRKIVLATSIAETSLTIEGVRIVIDSGLTRTQEYSLVTGLSRLVTAGISKASAEQRRGRAGRLEPGICYRLWTADREKQMADFTEPEILHSDLAPLALELAAWGVDSTDKLLWLDQPPTAAWRQASSFLREINALDNSGRLTAEGKKILDSGLEPRLGKLLLTGDSLKVRGLAARLAALLSEYDLRRNDSIDIRDLLNRVDSLKNVKELAHKLGATQNNQHQGHEFTPGLLLAAAYPDRIGKNCGNGKFLLTSGRRAAVPSDSPLSRVDYLVTPELDAGENEARIYLAAPVAENDLLQYYGRQIHTRRILFWDDNRKLFRAKSHQVLDKMVMSEKDIPLPSGAEAAEALLNLIRERGLDILPWNDEIREWRQRMNFLHRHQPNFPDFSDETLLDGLNDWLEPFCPTVISGNILERLELFQALKSRLNHQQAQMAEVLAPSRYVVPTGSRIKINYDNDPPILPVKLQEMFGCRETPRIMNGQIPLLIHLLSPAQRPVQVTSDLGGFWSNSYQYVRRDLRGRYPKHDWPEDPANALPRRGAKKRNW